MKALQQIVKRVAENPSLRWALATLVQTEGSTYRKPGARLLIEAVGKRNRSLRARRHCHRVTRSDVV
jgi:xanthine/CO dehydrogenase XdhC/CoxF family maturation factor